MLNHLRDSDLLVVRKLNRLPRLLKNALHILVRVSQAGIGFSL